MLSVVGKGNKHRVVPIPPILAPTLASYLHDVRPTLTCSAFVFVNPNAQVGGPNDGSYDPASVHNLVKAAGTGAGVAGRHFAHKWRHTYATSLLRRERDITEEVQRLLGHEKVATTEWYTHLVIDDLKAAVANAFPAPPTPPEPAEPAQARFRLLKGGKTA